MTTFPVTVTDAGGKSVTVEKQPQRVACYAIGCADLLYDLGVEPVAVSGNTLYAESLFGERAKSYALIGAVGATPNFEDAAKVRPDLILFSPPDARDGFNVIAPSFQVNYTKGYTGTLADLKTIGKLLGREKEAEAAEQRFRDKLAAYKAKSPNNLWVAVVFPSETGVLIQAKAGIVGSILSEVTPYPWTLPTSSVGFTGTFPYSIEQLLQDDPDVIFVADFAFDTRIAETQATTRRTMEASPFWKELTAVKNGRVYPIDRRTIDPYSPVRGRMMLDVVMPLLYPQVFPQALP